MWASKTFIQMKGGGGGGGGRRFHIVCRQQITLLIYLGAIYHLTGINSAVAQLALPAIDHARILGRATRISWPFSSCVCERAHLRCRNIPPGIHLMNKHWKLCAQWRGISFAAASRWQFLFAFARLANKESGGVLHITDRFLPSRKVDARRRCLLWAC